MHIKPYTPRQQTLIANNVFNACVNISKLNRTGYKFINLCCGFIAHYHLDGFRAAYAETGSLARDILRNVRFNQWDNFHPSDPSYAYYMSKRDIYNDIVARLRAAEF
jgi:hypothetical protein